RECNGTKRRNHEDGQQAGSHGVSAMRPGGKALQSLPEPFLPANQRTPGRGKGKNRISKKNSENRLRHSQEQLGLRRFPQLYLGRLKPVQTKSSRQLFMGGHGGHRDVPPFKNIMKRAQLLFASSLLVSSLIAFGDDSCEKV